jgi:hypothetical protein
MSLCAAFIPRIYHGYSSSLVLVSLSQRIRPAKLFLVRNDGGVLNTHFRTHFRTFAKPIGIAADYGGLQPADHRRRTRARSQPPQGFRCDIGAFEKELKLCRRHTTVQQLLSD